MQQQKCCCHLYFLFLIFLLVVLGGGGGGGRLSSAHNITRLLYKHPEFGTFNQYLSLTHLDADINDRNTITVLAVDNAAMDTFLLSTRHPAYSIYTLKNILSIHILLDYFDAKKLHQITDGSTIAPTLFQTTGLAIGTSGFLNITDLQGGKVGFGPHAYFVKSVEEVPYKISVLHITNILPSSLTPAPPPPDVMNLNSIMSAHGCMDFADALSSVPHAFKTFQDSINAGGLTAFCPTDGAFRQFVPKYKKLSAANKVSFLELYGIPMYMSMAMLRSNNGLSTNTLLTNNKLDLTIQKDDDDGQGITLKTKVNTVKISTTVFDQLPLVVYALDGVLLLSAGENEMAAPALAPNNNSSFSSSAPVKHNSSFSSSGSAPAPVTPPTESPKQNSFSSFSSSISTPVKPLSDSLKHNSSSSTPDTTNSPSESPIDSPDGDVADQTTSNARVVGDGATVVVMSLLLGFGVLLLQPF